MSIRMTNAILSRLFFRFTAFLAVALVKLPNDNIHRTGYVLKTPLSTAVNDRCTGIFDDIVIPVGGICARGRLGALD
jgi:hypothetical protein